MRVVSSSCANVVVSEEEEEVAGTILLGSSVGKACWEVMVMEATPSTVVVCAPATRAVVVAAPVAVDVAELTRRADVGTQLYWLQSGGRQSKAPSESERKRN